MNFKNDNSILRIQFDNNTIDHLGAKLYVHIGPIIAEFVSNSWDADANNLIITISDNDEIIIEDDGCGMTFDEINTNFLTIGRNRRKATQPNLLNNRQVIGKKGIGKLAGFGIANIVTIQTVKDKLENTFTMNYNDLKNSGNTYCPTMDTCNKKTNKQNGTTIFLRSLSRKTPINIDDIVTPLSKYFNIFDNINVIVKKGENEVTINNKTKYEKLTSEYQWDIPNDTLPESINSYAKYNKITGKLFTTTTPLSKDNSGITLFSRLRTVEQNSLFGHRGNDNFHQYITGYLDVDFIDIENEKEDFISSNRASLHWNKEEISPLKDFLHQIINHIGNDWKKKRTKTKEEYMKKTLGFDINTFIEESNIKSDKHKKFVKNLCMDIIGDPNIDTEKAITHMKSILTLMEYDDFIDTMKELQTTNLDIDKFLTVMNKLNFFEHYEFAKIAKSRIEIINKFQTMVKQNMGEVKHIQPFLESFPWLLNPQIIKFQREVQFEKLLKEKFPNENMKPEENKRIDFLCNTAGNTIYVIELKRPEIVIKKDQVRQLKDYVTFIKEYVIHKGNEHYREVKGYIISEHIDNTGNIELDDSKSCHYKSYTALIQEATSYHKDFLDQYNKLFPKNKL